MEKGRRGPRGGGMGGALPRSVHERCGPFISYQPTVKFRALGRRGPLRVTVVFGVPTNANVAGAESRALGGR